MMRNVGGTVVLWFVAACSADASLSEPDAAVAMDATTAAAPDAATPIERPCPYGAEGCACASSLGAALFRPDDCDDGLLCVSWHHQRPGPASYLTNPDSCVRPCESDGDCGAGRACRDVGVKQGDEPLFGCVDEVMDMDDFCGASRRTTSLAPGIFLRTPGVMRGCADGLTCQHFTDHHAEEGVCVILCGPGMNCPEEGVPYCNPIEAIRVCSERRNGFGAECGSRVPDKAGITNKCDGASNDGKLTCVSTTGVNANFGFCMKPCSEDEPCQGEEPGLGPLNCSSGVFCGVDCTRIPDNCSGDGVGYGRSCRSFATNGRAYNVCIDRLGPPLVPATINRGAWIDSREAENCSAVLFNEDPELAIRNYRCPEPTECLTFLDSPDLGICVPLCDVDTPETGDLYCTRVMSSTTARCHEPFGPGELAMCGDGE